MRCAACKKAETILWAHNGGKDIHRWDHGEQKDCYCQPAAICVECDLPVLHKYGFLVLDAAYFGHITSTVQ